MTVFVIGLTGSIGMGKSQTAKLFAAEGIPVFDADAATHEFYAPGGQAVNEIAAAFPGSVRDGAVDRTALSRAVANDAAAIAALEKIVHPLVARARQDFLRRHAQAPIAVLDIPLLLENAIAVDAVVVASAPHEIQKARVLARPGMTEEKFALLLARQMPDAQKRAQAHYVVMTGQGLDHAREQVKMILADVRKKIHA